MAQPEGIRNRPSQADLIPAPASAPAKVPAPAWETARDAVIREAIAGARHIKNPARPVATACGRPSQAAQLTGSLARTDCYYCCRSLLDYLSGRINDIVAARCMSGIWATVDLDEAIREPPPGILDALVNLNPDPAPNPQRTSS